MKSQIEHNKTVPVMPLCEVIKRGYFQQVRFLVDMGIDLDERDEEGRTPLMLCGFVEPEMWGVGMARLFIEKGACLGFRDKFGLNALHHACIYERVELAKVFLNAIDFDLTQGDRQGNTALHYAVKSGHLGIVRLLLHFLCRYGMSIDKQNKEGLTPLDEAIRHSYKGCIQALVSTDNYLDSQGDNEKLFHLSLKQSKDYLNDNISERSYGKPQRPRTAAPVVFRRRSSSSSYSSSVFSQGRSRGLPGPRVMRGEKREVLPNEKDTEKLIRCASLSDFRNNPEYLFHISPINGMHAPDGSGMGVRGDRRPKSAFVRRRDAETDSDEPDFSWRTEFKRLYVHYEYQCSPSYRESAKNPSDLPRIEKPSTPPQSEDEDDKNRKGRRTSVLSKCSTPDSSNTKRKQPLPPKGGRKSSTSSASATTLVHGKASTSSLDGSLASSNESLNSGVSAKKNANVDSQSPPPKASKEKSASSGNGPRKADDTQPAGRTSRTANYKPVPAVTVLEDADTPGATTNSLNPANIDPTKLQVLSDIDE